MNQVLHELTFYLMYACLLGLLFLGVERGLFFNHLARVGKTLEEHLGHGADLRQALQALPNRDDAMVQALDKFDRQGGATLRNEVQSNMLAQIIFFHTRGYLNRHLWIIDTIVTAAPLLGLLGTILGIVDTFTALASSGISDPKGVSGGIGTALYATGLGIGIAIIGLVLLNHFHSRLERLSEQLKSFLITMAIHDR